MKKTEKVLPQAVLATSNSDRSFLSKSTNAKSLRSTSIKHASGAVFRRNLPILAVAAISLFILTMKLPYNDLPTDLLDMPAPINAAVVAPTFFRDSNETVKICGITAMLGPYEKSAKEPTSPLDPSYPMFLVTDREDLINETVSAWTKVPLDPLLWKDDCLRDEFVGAPNNPCDQTYNFIIAKFYKEQPYRVPEIINAGCNVVVWMDGTIRIKDKTFMGHMKERAERGQNLVVSVHRPARKGLLSAEVENSVRNKKYQGRGGPDFGPFQNISRQFEQYVSEGFTERWFEQESWWPEVKGEAPHLYGMYVTCMVLFDLRKKSTKTFLDCWWKENILHSTQDQVSFPYCSWKHKVNRTTYYIPHNTCSSANSHISLLLSFLCQRFPFMHCPMQTSRGILRGTNILIS